MDLVSLTLQIAASITTLIALWLIGNKHPHGPAMCLVGDGCFVILNIYLGLWPLLVFTTIVALLHLRALFMWRAQRFAEELEEKLNG